MSYTRSSGGAGASDLSSGLGRLSSTCLSSICSLKDELGNGSRISSGWTDKSTGKLGATIEGSGIAIEGIYASSGKRSKTKEEDREARK